MIRRFGLAIGAALCAIGCKDTSGPAIAVTLHLYSVDGVVIPAPLVSPFGTRATIGTGRLQGNNRGAACGFAVGLAEGPVSMVQVPDCRLKEGEERTFSVTFTDSRFPAGTHQYRFVPE